MIEAIAEKKAVQLVGRGISPSAVEAAALYASNQEPTIQSAANKTGTTRVSASKYTDEFKERCGRCEKTLELGADDLVSVNMEDYYCIECFKEKTGEGDSN